MDYKIKEHYIEAEVKRKKPGDNPIITIIGNPSEATELEKADELNNLSGDIEKDVERIASQLAIKNDALKEMLTIMPDGKYKLKRYILC